NPPAPTTPSSLVFPPEVAEGLRGCDNFVEIHGTVRASPAVAEDVMARLFDVSKLEALLIETEPDNARSGYNPSWICPEVSDEVRCHHRRIVCPPRRAHNQCAAGPFQAENANPAGRRSRATRC